MAYIPSSQARRAPPTDSRNWALRTAEGPLMLPARFHLGLLGHIGRILDIPARKLLREPFTGKEDATGRDVLEKLHILGPNKPGFDWGDVAGFGAEVVGDPLTWMGGIGVLGKGGKLASMAGKATDLADAARLMGKLDDAAKFEAQAAKYAERATKAGAKVSTGLAEGGWGAQAKAGQRALLSAGVPGTRLQAPLVRAPKILDVLEKAGAGIKGAIPETLQKMSSTKYGKVPRAEAFYTINKLAREQGTGEAGDILKEITTAMEGVSKATGTPMEELGLKVMRGTEALGQPMRLRARAEELIEKAQGMTRARSRAKAERQAQHFLEQAEVAERTLADLPEGGMPIAQRLSDIFHEVGQTEIRAGARGVDDLLRALTKGYSPRVAGEGLQRFKAEHPKTWKNLLSRVYSTAMGSKIKRQEPLLEMFTPEASAKLQELHGLKGPAFELNPAKAAAQRVREGRIATANAELAKGLVQKFAEDVTPETGARLMDVPEFFKQAGIVGQDVKAWKGKGLPMDIAGEFLRLNEKLSVPEEFTKLARVLDTATGIYRTALTTPWPAFHFRNLLSDTILSWLGDGADIRVLPEVIQAMRNPQRIRELEELGVLRGMAARDIMREIGAKDATGAAARFYGKHPKLKGAASWIEKKYTQRTETFTRTWHFLSKKRQGLSDLDAAASTRRWLLDYSDLTDFERKVMRRTFLFYQWPRKVLPLLLRAYIEQPGKMAMLTRATTQPSMQRPDMPLPKFVQQSAAMPIGVDEQGNPRFLFGTGSPLEEFNKLDLSSAAGGFWGAAGEGLRKIGMQLNPLALKPTELMMGKELYFDRPLIQADKAPAILNLPGLRQIFGIKKQQLPSGGTRLHGDPYALWALTGSPASRGVQTITRGANVFADIDPQSSRLWNLAQILTGIKVARVDEMDRARTELQALQDQLRPLQREGLAGEFPAMFALGKEGEKDPEVLRILRVQRELRKKLKVLREKGVQAPP